jgi:hypothetical protein
VNGVIVVRFNDGYPASRVLIHPHLIHVTFGHGYGGRREYVQGLSSKSREIGEIAMG